MIKKRGVSGVVTTVLIIMLAIIAVTMVYYFIKSFTQENLSKADCFKIRDHISVDDEFSCYNSTTTILMIKLGESEEIKLKGMVVSLKYSGASTRYELINGTEVNGVKMYGGSSIIRIPGIGSALTYLFDTSAKSADISAIKEDGKACEAITEKIKMC